MTRKSLKIGLMILSLVAVAGCARSKETADPSLDPESIEHTDHIIREEVDSLSNTAADVPRDEADTNENNEAQDALTKIGARHLGVGAEVINQYIVVGKKAWDIVEQSKPVIDVQTEKASVLPVAEKDWRKMSGWSKQPAVKSSSHSIKHQLGYEVAYLKYTITAMYGGSLDGKGKYLANVAVIPEIRAFPLFKISMRAEIGQILNVGTPEDPIVSMELKINWRIDNLRTRTGTDIYYVTGDGTITRVGAE